MNQILRLLTALLVLVSTLGLRNLRPSIHTSRSTQLTQIPRAKMMKLELLPQIAFVATCAGMKLIQ